MEPQLSMYPHPSFVRTRDWIIVFASFSLAGYILHHKIGLDQASESLVFSPRKGPEKG